MIIDFFFFFWQAVKALWVIIHTKLQKLIIRTMEKKKKKTVNVFFSEQIERFLFRAFWSTAIICNLSSSDEKKKKEWLSIIAAYPQTQYSYMFVWKKKKKYWWHEYSASFVVVGLAYNSYQSFCEPLAFKESKTITQSERFRPE